MPTFPPVTIIKTEKLPEDIEVNITEKINNDTKINNDIENIFPYYIDSNNQLTKIENFKNGSFVKIDENDRRWPGKIMLLGDWWVPEDGEKKRRAIVVSSDEKTKLLSSGTKARLVNSINITTQG